MFSEMTNDREGLIYRGPNWREVAPLFYDDKVHHREWNNRLTIDDADGATVRRATTSFTGSTAPIHRRDIFLSSS